MIRPSDALAILTKIRAYHGPQDVSQATCAAWAEALNEAHVTSVTNCLAAVTRHYATPGTNPWITPGDVAGLARAIGDDRLERTEIPTPNAPASDTRAWLAEYRAMLAAIRSGDLTGPRLDAYRRGDINLTGAPLALEGHQTPADPARAIAMVRAALPPSPTERERQAERERDARDEAERARQAAALTELTEEDGQ